MSIRPEFARAIIDGRKTVEFRKRPLADDVTHIVIYATQPVGALLGWVTVDAQLTMNPIRLWHEFKTDGAISKSRFFDYFASDTCGTGIRVSSVVKFDEPVSLSLLDGVSRPPQSFQYLTRGQAAAAFTAPQPQDSFL